MIRISPSLYRIIRLVLTLVLILLINRIASLYPLRADLTDKKVYTLSDISRKALEDLEEPVTLRFFLSENLPQPYGNLVRGIEDLMETYALEKNRYFSYEILKVSGSGDTEMHDRAEEYGIPAFAVQDIQGDELKLINARMGVVFLQGNRQLTIPVLNPESNLEYKITSALRKLTRQSGQLLDLEEDISVNLGLSRAFFQLDDGLKEYPRLIEDLVEELGPAWYNRIDFRQETLPGNAIRAELTIRGNGRSYTRDLIPRQSGEFSIPSPAEIGDFLNEAIPLMLGTGGTLGYLTSHGTLPLYGEGGLNNFSRLISENYDIRPLKVSDISRSAVPLLVIAGASDRFSKQELEDLNRFIRNGGSLALFQDSHRTLLPPEEALSRGELPEYIPEATGLMTLTEPFGLSIDSAYVLDESCFSRYIQDDNGQLTELPVYYAPVIGKKSINLSSPAMNNLQGLIALNTAPVIAGEGTSVLFSSSGKSWLMKENINLYNPMRIHPPSGEERASYPLAALSEGGTERGTLFLAGSSAYLEDSFMDEDGNTPNAMMVLNLMDLLCGNADNAELRSKGQSYNPLNEISTRGKILFREINRTALPLLVALTGFAAYLKRKRRQKQILYLFSTGMTRDRKEESHEA